MLMPFGAVMLGLVCLVWSADKFVLGAASVASHFNVSPVMIGLTIVAIGTSAPEILVSGIAAGLGKPTLGIGNALGSNIANIALVLGATAIIRPILVDKQIVRREFPLLFAITILVGVLLVDEHFSFIDGLILGVAFAFLTGWLLKQALYNGKQTEDNMDIDDLPPRVALGLSFVFLIVGLIVLLISSRGLVWGASELARQFGISEMIVGLTIVSIGTSLPELATSISGARKGHHSMVIGGIIGSNMFNSLAVLSLPGLLSAGRLEPAVMQRDYPIMVLLTLLLFLLSYGFRRPAQIDQKEGCFFVFIYGAYLCWLYVSS